MKFQYVFIVVCVMLLVGCERQPKVRVYDIPKEESKAAVPVMAPEAKQESSGK